MANYALHPSAAESRRANAAVINKRKAGINCEDLFPFVRIKSNKQHKLASPISHGGIGIPRLDARDGRS